MQDEPKSDERERGEMRYTAAVKVGKHTVTIEGPDKRQIENAARAAADEIDEIGYGRRVVTISGGPVDIRAEVVLAPVAPRDDETRARPSWFPHVNELDHTAALAWKNAKGDTPHRAVVDAVTELILSRVPAPASQDRIRAIVAAAENLAKAIELRVSEEFPGTADYCVSDLASCLLGSSPTATALHDLARALALPESPPVQWIHRQPNERAPDSIMGDSNRSYLLRHRLPGTARWSYLVDDGFLVADFPIEHESEWWPVPLDNAFALPMPRALQSSLRDIDSARRDAIVMEAENLAVEFGAFSPPSWDDIGDCIGIGRAVAIKRVFDAVGMKSPAPDWTREPPKESGLWWCRDTSSNVPVIAVASRMEDGRMFFRNLEGERVRDWGPTVEWWPVPISPPPVSP